MDSYRSLDAWKVAHQLSLEVLEQTDDHYHPRSRSLFDQIRRASVSIEANLVEGYALRTAAQFRHHLKIALGLAAETECVLDLIATRRYLPDKVSAKLDALVRRMIGLIFGLLRSTGSG